MTEESRRFVRRPRLERPQLHGRLHGATTASSIPTWPRFIRSIRPTRREFDVSSSPPATERAGLSGPDAFPDAHQQAGRHGAHRPRPFCEGAVSVPACSRLRRPAWIRICRRRPESKPVTNRERLAAHATNPSCALATSSSIRSDSDWKSSTRSARCREQHKLLFYPGRPRRAARGKPKEVLLDIDTSGPGRRPSGFEFSSPRELGELLAERPICQECVVKQLFRYMSGRPETPADRPLIAPLSKHFAVRASASRKRW